MQYHEPTDELETLESIPLGVEPVTDEGGDDALAFISFPIFADCFMI